MNLNQKGSSVAKALLITIIALIVFLGVLIYPKNSEYKDGTPSQQAGQDITKKDGLYFRNKYKNISDQDDCLEEYYDTYPENKPDNQDPQKIYLPAPCPGMPQ